MHQNICLFENLLSNMTIYFQLFGSKQYTNHFLLDISLFYGKAYKLCHQWIFSFALQRPVEPAGESLNDGASIAFQVIMVFATRSIMYGSRL
jgi:hypothetical protein